MAFHSLVPISHAQDKTSAETTAEKLDAGKILLDFGESWLVADWSRLYISNTGLSQAKQHKLKYWKVPAQDSGHIWLKLDLDRPDIEQTNCPSTRLTLSLDEISNFAPIDDIWRRGERPRKPTSIPNLSQFENEPEGFSKFGEGSSHFQIERDDLRDFRGGPVRPRCQEILGTTGTCNIQIALPKEIGVEFKYSRHDCGLENIVLRTDSIMQALKKYMLPAKK